MPVFVEDPAQLSVSRLKSDLIAHNVQLPPAKSKKEVYVELHMKHVDQQNAVDFSSDEEEDPVQDVAEEEESEDEEIPDPSSLTDDDLKAALLLQGVKAGPIVASTRALYEKKLRKLLQSNRQNELNGTEQAVLYSDTEEEEEDEEEDNDKESGSGGAKQETAEQSEQDREESRENGGYVYPQCFLLSSRLRTHASRRPPPKRNSRNVLKSSEQRGPAGQIPARISRATSLNQGLSSGAVSGSKSVLPNGSASQTFSITQMMESRRSLSTSVDSEPNESNTREHSSQSSRLDIPVSDKNSKKNQSLFYTPKATPSKRATKLPHEPSKDPFNDLLPDIETTPTGIYATCRRPIKGAAGRPVQYAYPDTPISPTTLERKEREHHIVPIQIQIAAFFIVMFVMYVVYVFVEDNSFSPLLAFLESQNQASDDEEGLLLPAETQDTPAVFGQE